MAATVKGRGVVWSTGGITYTAGIVSTSHADFAQSLRFSRVSEKAEIKDNGGSIRTVVFHGGKRTLSLTVVPCALSGTNTIANAEASLDAHVVAAGTTVTVVDSLAGSSGATSLIEGVSYNVITATQNRTLDGVATIDLELEGSDEGIDITTAVS